MSLTVEKQIEVGPAAKVPWYRHDPGGPTVSLGCGTLIMIGIIVAIFSRGDGNSDAIRDLQKEVQALEQKD